ncbi:glycosyltransferase [Rasiella rasia]|uniref:Glycosyltransferase n=1 Tax=Rasiella rasia TaxID=2744027 RepID=A0A6G6GLI3_9FLAO|nr:TIGR04282 family arsenosugar biosynthesis glycosyltransferase [Rasiella rasia]QIE59412.1 glycosyltransferase [Rasiella rasia]
MGILGSKHTDNKENGKEVFHFPTSKNALIIFTRNPELGKCKTRLAATVGDEIALEIYTFLLRHTAKISAGVQADKFVYYSEQLHENDVWDTTKFRKKVQHGDDLGARMEQAFNEIFSLGYQRAIIIGSDMYDMNTNDLDNAFETLEKNKFVLGPAEDGGYYLLGMKEVKPEVFKNKTWGTDTVLQATINNLKDESLILLQEKNDVDYYEDIKDVDAFHQFLPVHLTVKTSNKTT